MVVSTQSSHDLLKKHYGTADNGMDFNCDLVPRGTGIHSRNLEPDR